MKPYFYRIAHLLLIVGILYTGYASAAPSMRAWLDRNQVADGEIVQLSLEASGQIHDNPDTAALRKDFDVQSISRGSQISIVNGHSDSHTTWQITLIPKHIGFITIPSLTVGGQSSSPLGLTVSSTPVASSGDAADIFIETELTPKTPYVQAQMIYTLRLFHAVPIQRGDLSEPASGNMLVQRLGKDRSYVKYRHQRRYEVIERRYALFPQKSGTLALKAPVFNGEVPTKQRAGTGAFPQLFGNDPFFGRGILQLRRVRVRGTMNQINIKPRPAGAQGADWMPAQKVSISGLWQPPHGAVHVGDPITLTLTIRAKGLTGGQIPDLLPATIAHVRIYPDQAKIENKVDTQGVLGIRTRKIAMIPQSEGDMIIPAIRVNWWNTRTDMQESAQLPARRFHILPASGKLSSMSPNRTQTAISSPLKSHADDRNVPSKRDIPIASHTINIWIWVSAGFALLWLITLVLWTWARHKAKNIPHNTHDTLATLNRKEALTRIRTACRAHDPAAARIALLNWATQQWPDKPPMGLDALSLRLDIPDTQAVFTAIDQAVYQHQAHWQGDTLMDLLKKFPTHHTGMKQKSEKQLLPPLYPE